MKRLPKTSTVLQNLYQNRIQKLGQSVVQGNLEDRLLDIEEHLHADYLEVQAYQRQRLPVQARIGLDKVLAGLKIQAELTLMLGKVRVAKCFLSRLRQAQTAIESGRDLFQQALSLGTPG